MNYYQTLKNWQKRELERDYLVQTRRLGLSKQKVYDPMKHESSSNTVGYSHKTTYGYDILQNKKYQEIFWYRPTSEEGRLGFVGIQEHWFDPDDYTIKKNNSSKDFYKTNQNLETMWACTMQLDYVRLICDLAYLEKDKLREMKKFAEQRSDSVSALTTDNLVNYYWS